MNSRRRAIAGLSGVVAIAGLAGTPTLADDSHSVTILNTHSDVAAEFHTAKCNKLKDGRFIATTKRVNGYKLIAVIDAFKGFGVYDLSQGRNADPYVIVSMNGGATRYSNLFEPPFPSPGFGQIRFSRGGKLMGVGYHPAYSMAGDDAVTVAGVLTCKYPKRK